MSDFWLRRGVCGYEIMILTIEAVGGGGRGRSEVFVAGGKVRETGGSGMVISEILCLFVHIDCPLLFLTLLRWSHPHIDEAG